MIRSYDIIALLRDPLAEDTDIATWLDGIYGKRQIVSVGWDWTHKPEVTDADCPLIALRPRSERAGQEEPKNDIVVVLNLALWESRNKNDAPAGARVPECWWVERMTTFANYVWEASKTALNASGLPIKTVTCDYEDGLFPLTQVVCVYTFSVQQTLGSSSEPSLP